MRPVGGEGDSGFQPQGFANHHGSWKTSLMGRTSSLCCLDLPSSVVSPSGLYPGVARAESPRRLAKEMQEMNMGFCSRLVTRELICDRGRVGFFSPHYYGISSATVCCVYITAAMVAELGGRFGKDVWFPQPPGSYFSRKFFWLMKGHAGQGVGAALAICELGMLQGKYCSSGISAGVGNPLMTTVPLHLEATASPWEWLRLLFFLHNTQGRLS